MDPEILNAEATTDSWSESQKLVNDAKRSYVETTERHRAEEKARRRERVAGAKDAVARQFQAGALVAALSYLILSLAWPHAIDVAEVGYHFETELTIWGWVSILAAIVCCVGVGTAINATAKRFRL